MTGDEVKRAIGRAVRALKRKQLPNGEWPALYAYRHGETCLATFALLQAGEPADAPHMAAALEIVEGIDHQDTYVVSLKILTLLQADPDGYRRQIESAARWLAMAQLDSGLWGYTDRSAAFDHSNSQFALLALHAAAQNGARVPPAVWQRARQRVLSSQNRDGGWGYRDSGRSYGSMTAANVCNLAILGAPTVVSTERPYRDGAAAGCGNYAGNRPVANGLEWLARRFVVDANPEHGRDYTYYWLYAVERAGILTGRASFGRHDWYRAGAAFLVASQQPDGNWGRNFTDTCFGLLFLAKGHKPLLIQKLQWARDERWNLDRHDLANLLAYAGDRLGEPAAWQAIPFDAPLEEWLAAPLLYMQGHEFPEWSPAQREKIRRFVESGGTLLAEACCSRAEFRTGFEKFASETFPDLPLRELDSGHPVYSSHFNCAASGLMGIDVGCRTSVIFAPRDLSCLWEQGKPPPLAEPALQLGVNIAAYAAGRSALRDRLDVVTLPQPAPGAPPGPPRQDALRFTQVVYDGDWQPDPQALVHFAEFLRDATPAAVITQPLAARLTEDALADSPLLYLTGHYAFDLSASELEALRAHLKRGGFLFADACCGRPAFDQSFRTLIRRAFPEVELKRLPADHAMFNGRPGFDVTRVRRKAFGNESTEPAPPELWSVELDGRLAVIYSPLAIGCGLDGHRCYNCRGIEDDDARRLAATIVLHALTH